MIFLPYNKGNNQLGILYIGIFVFILFAYIFSSADIQIKSNSIYFLILSQILLSLGLYCLLPKHLDKSIDLGGFNFVLIPIIIEIIINIIINSFLGLPLSAMLTGDTLLEVYLICYVIGVSTTLGLFFLQKNRFHQYQAYFRSLAHIDDDKHTE